MLQSNYKIKNNLKNTHTQKKPVVAKFQSIFTSKYKNFYQKVKGPVITVSLMYHFFSTLNFFRSVRCPASKLFLNVVNFVVAKISRDD